MVETIARLSAPPAAKNIVDSSTRIEAFRKFCREKHNADIAILGSSLALAATFEHGGESDYKFSVNDWSKSISQAIGRNVKVVNLAWHAGMFSDCNKTLKAYLHAQKTPQIVLLMTAPREFSDNLTAQTGALAGYSVEPDSFTTLDSILGQRYNPTNAKNVKHAEIALKELQEICTAKGIYLILLNMPLTRENRALIAPETYTNFIEKLNSAALAPNCLLVDAGKNSNFSNSDFHDSVHLNRSGKEKLRELIFPALTEKLTDQKSALTVGTKSGTVHDTNQ